MGIRSTFATTRGAARLSSVLAALALRPMTAAQLGEQVGISRSLAWQCADFLHGSKPKRAFVAGWFPTGGKLAALYALGDFPDVAKPMPVRRWRRTLVAIERAEQERSGAARRAAVERARELRKARRETRKAAQEPPAPPPEPPPIALQTWCSALTR